jgi:hypothetical protein
MLMSDITRTPLSTPETATDRRAHHQGDQADLNPLGVGDAEQVVQAGVEVQHAKAHVGTQAEHRGDDAEAIHRVADRAVDALADQRVQRRTQRQRQVMPVGEIGQRHADEGEHAPAVQAPVQKQDLHRLARGLGVPASPWGGCSMWVSGSETQKKNSVMLMPAANSMPAQDR